MQKMLQKKNGPLNKDLYSIKISTIILTQMEFGSWRSICVWCMVVDFEALSFCSTHTCLQVFFLLLLFSFFLQPLFNGSYVIATIHHHLVQ
jgi:hypothetical protein